MSSETFVYLGNNINFDYICPLKNDTDFAVVQKLFKAHAPEFLSAFENAVAAPSEAREDLLPAALVDGILAELPGELVLGGQEAFFLLNVLNQFVPRVTPVIHLPSRSERFVSYLRRLPNAEYIRVFECDEPGCVPRLVPLDAIQTVDEPAPVHAILEYQTGARFTGSNGAVIETSRANRYIASYDPINSTAALDHHFAAACEAGFIDERWIVLFSGYHLLGAEIITPEFVAAHKSVVKALTKARWTHYELAYTGDEAVRHFIENDILPQCDSIGLNEVELRQTAEGILTAEQAALPHGPLLEAYAAHLRNDVSTIFFHCLGLYAVSSDKVSTEQLQCGFECADNHIVKTRTVADSVISSMVPEATEYLREHGFQTFNPRLIAPISSTVGLGDTISSSIVLGSILN